MTSYISIFSSIMVLSRIMALFQFCSLFIYHHNISLMHRVLCYILQFNLIYLTDNTNTLAYFKLAEITNLSYNRIDLLVSFIFYLNKHPVVGWKQITHFANIQKNNTVSSSCLEIRLNSVNLRYVYRFSLIGFILPFVHDKELHIWLW